MIPVKDRIYELMEVKNITQADIIKKTNIPKSSLSMYISGARVPKSDKIILIADSYNVSPEWLSGFDVPMEKQIVNDLEIGSSLGKMLTGKEMDILPYFDKLSKLKPADQEMVFNLINSLYEKVEG